MAGFSVVISATDRLTGTLDKINKKAAAFGAPFKKAQASLAKFGDVSGLKAVGKSFGDVAAGARDAFGKISQIVAPLGVISGAASVAGMYRLVAAWSEWGTQLGFAAQNMALTASQLGNLQGAARLAGASAGALTGGLQNLGQTMFDAIGGRAPEAVVMFNTLGISFRDATGHARGVADVMPEIANKIASIKDPFVQAKIATELFGGAGVELLPFLRKGAAGIRELQAETAKYNPVTQQSVDAANNFRLAQTKLQMSVEGLGNRISTQLAPIIAPLLTQLADWIATSPQVQSGVQALGNGVRQLAGYLQTVDWASVGNQILSWGGAIGSAISSLGGLRTIVEVVAGVFALKAAIGIGGFGLTLLKLGLTVGRVGAMFLPLLATPVGAAIAIAVGAVAALGLAGYELWTHWSAVTGWFSGLWDGLKTAWKQNTGYLRTATELLFPLPMMIIGHWDVLTGFFGRMWDGIKAGFSDAWKFLSPIIDDLKAGVAFVANSWLGKKLGLAADAVGGAVVAAGNGIGAAASAVGGGISAAANAGAAGLDRAMGFSGGSSRPSSAEQAKLAQQATAYFVGQGWTPAQAAGIAANLQQESGFNAGAVGDSGNAHGVAQWHGDRQRAIEQHFGKSLSQMSAQEQFAAVNWELRNGSEQGAGRRLALATDAQSAGAAVSQFYERPGDVEGEKARRGGMADQIATRFAAAVNAQGSTMQAPNTAPTGGTGSGDGTVTVRLEHANAPPTGFGASIAGTSGSLGGAQVAQANVMSQVP